MGRQTPDGDMVKIMAWEIASYNCNNLLCFAIAKKKSKKAATGRFLQKWNVLSLDWSFPIRSQDGLVG